MIYALGVVLVVYALSASVYGAVHSRVMSRAISIPPRVRTTIALRERVVVPAGLLSAAGALLATAQGCHLALAALVAAAAVSAILDGGIAAALVVAGRDTGPAIARVHLLAGAGALGAGPAILERLEQARQGLHPRPPTPEA